MLKSSMRIALPALMVASLIPIIAAHAKKAEPPFVAKKGVESEAATAQSSPTNPLDPAAMLLMGSQANDLDGPDVRPWHVRVSYQTFDSDGDPDKSGTFEEFWASPKKYKRIYTGDDFNQIDVATDQGLFRNGSQEWPVEL